MKTLKIPLFITFRYRTQSLAKFNLLVWRMENAFSLFLKIHCTDFKGPRNSIWFLYCKISLVVVLSILVFSCVTPIPSGDIHSTMSCSCALLLTCLCHPCFSCRHPISGQGSIALLPGRCDSPTTIWKQAPPIGAGGAQGPGALQWCPSSLSPWLSREASVAQGCS